ncbi:hypothetical protein [Mesorhizobium captivum]|uniref:hypothetical protein n=1 Tax=Mesorhizobium captivum TaxID=3072319 RepID=UPI002A23A309|nr:hypothetical protein [Mesorhizobium sp. VK3C]MDX8449467.1 hypothetical protein [Mesorhizobium sp. VK3C]
MAHKQVLFRSAAREKILRGATQLADAVRVTLGPRRMAPTLSLAIRDLSGSCGDPKASTSICRNSRSTFTGGDFRIIEIRRRLTQQKSQTWTKP